MKKLVALILLITTVISLAAPAYALTKEQNETLKEYASIMEGEWQIERLDWLKAIYGKQKADIAWWKITFHPENLSITNDNRVFYGTGYDNYYDDYGVSGGEVLLVYNNPNRFGLVFDYNGCTKVVYYNRIQ